MKSSFKSVPVIDISELYSTNQADRQKVAEQIGRAAHDVGFMYISGHQVSESAISGLQTSAKQFFDLPMSEKMDVYIGKSPCHRGYVPEGQEIFDEGRKPDHKEALDFGKELDKEHASVAANVPMHGSNQWPSLHGFKQKVQTYYDQVYELSRVLTHGFALALGQDENAFDEMFNDNLVTLRMVHYPYDEAALEPDSQGIGAHTDYECFTILLATSPGLEVKNSDNEWVQAPPIPNTFVVNIGDTLEILTNNRFTATAHRVRRVVEDRFSFPMFVGCNYFTEVAPLPQFVSGETQKKYSKVVSGDHVWSSIIQTHQYLLDKVNSGEIVKPAGTQDKGAYGRLQEAS